MKRIFMITLGVAVNLIAAVSITLMGALAGMIFSSSYILGAIIGFGIYLFVAALIWLDNKYSV